MSKNPANRYQSAAEMRADLIRVRNGQQPLAPMVMTEEERTTFLNADTNGGATRRIAAAGGGGGGRHTMSPGEVQPWQDEPERKHTGRKIGIGVAVAAVLALLAFVAFEAFGGPSTPDQVAVPNVVGALPDAARAQISTAGLLVNLKQEPSTVELNGKVTRTDPASNVQVAERSTVTIFVGTGPAQATVPALDGKTPAEAQALLEARGLTLGDQTEQETSDESKVGKVLSSSPAAGVDAPGGSAVAVVVGKEQTTVAVPDVSGQTEDQAKQTLTNAGFQTQSTEVDGAGQEGSVVGTNPQAGTRVEKGSTITLQVSKGNRAEMPNVVGQTVNDAARTLSAAGITKNVQAQGQQVSDSSQNNRVLAQSVPAGTAIDPDNTQITLTIGQSGDGGGGGNGDGDGLFGN
jgi:serine/threonine-protein kinase